MNVYAKFFSASLLLVVSFAASGHAEVKEVRMKIGGYLCGM
jgi:hypothetical protein